MDNKVKVSHIERLIDKTGLTKEQIKEVLDEYFIDDIEKFEKAIQEVNPLDIKMPDVEDKSDLFKRQDEIRTELNNVKFDRIGDASFKEFLKSKYNVNPENIDDIFKAQIDEIENIAKERNIKNIPSIKNDYPAIFRIKTNKLQREIFIQQLEDIPDGKISTLKKAIKNSGNLASEIYKGDDIRVHQNRLKRLSNIMSTRFEEEPPIEEVKIEEQVKPVEEQVKPVEEIKVEEQVKPVEEIKVEEQVKPVEEVKIEEPFQSSVRLIEEPVFNLQPIEPEQDVVTPFDTYSLPTALIGGTLIGGVLGLGALGIGKLLYNRIHEGSTNIFSKSKEQIEKDIQNEIERVKQLEKEQPERIKAFQTDRKAAREKYGGDIREFSQGLRWYSDEDIEDIEDRRRENDR